MGKIIKLNKRSRFGMHSKLNLSFIAISVILLISSLISVLEYKRMSSYMSKIIESDVKAISTVRSLTDFTSQYNQDILSVLGDSTATSIPFFDAEHFEQRLKSIDSNSDTLLAAFHNYINASYGLKSYMSTDFDEAKVWYFDTLQPKYDSLNVEFSKINAGIYADLSEHTKDFDGGFYRSIIPSSVAVAVSLLLVILLLFFINSYYILPLLQIHKNLKSYLSYNKRYNVGFEGDDEITEINEGIKEICEENLKLKKESCFSNLS